MSTRMIWAIWFLKYLNANGIEMLVSPIYIPLAPRQIVNVRICAQY